LEGGGGRKRSVMEKEEIKKATITWKTKERRTSEGGIKSKKKEKKGVKRKDRNQKKENAGPPGSTKL